MSTNNRPLRGARTFLLSTGLIVAVSAACGKEYLESGVENESSNLSSFFVSGAVLPASETQTFDAFAKPWTAPDAFSIESMVVTIASVGDDRTIEARHGDVFEGPLLVDSNGEVPLYSAEFPIGRDVLAQLPREGMTLEEGRTYENAPPTPALVLENHAAEAVTMLPRIESTPTFIESTEFGTLVRLHTVAFNHITIVDPDLADLVYASPELRDFDAGFAYVGVTDLLFVPGQGWRTLQTTRLSPVDNPVANAADIDSLRAGPHHVFTACGRFEGIDPMIVAWARDAAPRLPELDACR